MCGLVNLANPYDRGIDEGGQFIVIGDVFSGEYGKCAVIDGDLRAADLIVNAYSDAALWVVGGLQTKFRHYVADTLKRAR